MTIFEKISFFHPDRTSTVTFTLADSAKKTSLNVDVEYVPTKRVSHFIVFNKDKKQLEASVEFLPKMFAKLSSRLEKGKPVFVFPRGGALLVSLYEKEIHLQF